jgi:putative ABC transport system permease protein
MGGSLVSVAGIVSDARDSLAKSAQPTLYLPTLEDPNINEFLVRAQHVPSLAADITRALRSAEPQMSDPRIVPYSALVARNAAAARNVALLLTLLALIALVLAIGGIYGIMAYTVQQRTGEIGLRMALGASLAAVLRSVIFNAFTIAMAGIAIGFIVIAAGLRGQWVSALLYNVAPLDPTTLAVVLGLFFVCVLIASFIPAARAATVDPANALRYE